MARVIHLLKAGDSALALEMIGQQTAAGDAVTLALLPGATVTPPAGVRAHRVPDELSWQELLEQIFAADQVVAW